MGTLLQVSADACAAALARGDPHVVADVGDLPRELVELVALSYFKFKLTRRDKKTRVKRATTRFRSPPHRTTSPR